MTSEKKTAQVSPWETRICPNCGGELLQFGDFDWDVIACKRNTNVVFKDGGWVQEIRPFTEKDSICYSDAF